MKAPLQKETLAAKVRNATPIILSLVLISLIIVLALRRLGRQGVWDAAFINGDIVLASVYLFWMVIESKVSKKELDKGSQISDFGTCELYAIGQAGVFLSALWFDSLWSAPNALHLLGALIFGFGITYRLWAVRTLGKYYSHIVRQVSEHKIISAGPYAHIRHPAYAGMLLVNLGIVVFFFNYTTLALFLTVLTPAVVLRIFVEEKMLFQLEGYTEFARHRKRLIPSVW